MAAATYFFGGRIYVLFLTDRHILILVLKIEYFNNFIAFVSQQQNVTANSATTP